MRNRNQDHNDYGFCDSVFALEILLTTSGALDGLPEDLPKNIENL